jgi:hypothetical protein
MHSPEYIKPGKILSEQPADPVYCTTFACGRVLTGPEQLQGNKCMKCLNKDEPAHTLILRDKFNDTYFDTIILKK